MNENNIPFDINSLKKQFQSDRSAKGPYIYLPLDCAAEDDDRDRIIRLLSGYKKSGYIGIIPFINRNSFVRALSDQYYEAYDMIKEIAAEQRLLVSYLDDKYIMKEYLVLHDDMTSAVCTILNRYEYACVEGEIMRKTLHETGSVMSLVAVNDYDRTIIDVREFVKDGVLEWEVPKGNWNIEEYVCEPDEDSYIINAFDYDVCMTYLRNTFGKLFDRYSSAKVKNTADNLPLFNLFMYRNVNYAGKNHRMWHKDFNKVFEEEYGFDPSPYYTLMFRSYGGHSDRYKTMLMACRSKMLIDGYMKAAADYCRARGVKCTGCPTESKATACSWMFGDGQMLHKHAWAPGISMPFAYLYGLNGVKVAAGAADLFGTEVVSADLFKYYTTLTRDVIYRESMNVFVRGGNMVLAHLGEDRIKDNSDIKEKESEAQGLGSIFSKGDDLTEYATFVSRVQTMLQGGDHICEAAIVYPIHTLHAYSSLYQAETQGFEYPSTPDNADYMELMNSMLSYVGIDTSFIHPDALADRTYTENGVLHLNSGNNGTKIKLLIIPSTSIIGLKALKVIKKFYDEGGKIIATIQLPLGAIECSTVFDNVNTALLTDSKEDNEVIDIIRYIFGEDVLNNKLYRSYYKNENKNGGIAYFLPSNKTSADRMETVSADMLLQAAGKFELAPDVFIDKMPRREFLGVLGFHLPVFRKIGVDKRLSKACSMNYIHKKFAGCDIFYITNTLGNEYKGSILLRGNHVPEEWNPYTGKIRKLNYKSVKFKNEVYTAVDAEIDSSSCIFIVSHIQRTQKEIVRDLSETSEPPIFYPKINY